MRRFQVTVNGTPYEVEIEEYGAASVNAPAAAPVAPVQAPVAAKPAAPKAAAPVAATPIAGDGVKVSAPMPGTILDVKCAVGAPCKKNDVLVILEAMKMENEISAPQDGVIKQILVSKGASVNTGEALVVIG